MKKEITVSELATELIARIEAAKGIDCCKDEIKLLARLAGDKLPNEKVMVTWKD